MKIIKVRLDDLVVKKGFADSKSKAQSIIMSGKIYLKEQKLSKPGYVLPINSEINFRGAMHPWVSRGGLKLDYGIKNFKIIVKNMIALDIGASTGGFSHVLLERGAKKIYSVDVGYGQFHEKLSNNDKIILKERTNARYLSRVDIPDEIDVLVCDVSFISLKKVLVEPIKLLSSNAQLICLIKPQFEVGKSSIAKGGVVKDESVRKECCKDIRFWFQNYLGFKVSNLLESPIKGPKGNIEYLIHACK
tara:strand:+ start:10139 stop:10879 length:741 start_codon:yes stop_codon:yes gene_type:complete